MHGNNPQTILHKILCHNFIRRNPGYKILCPFLAKELNDSSWYAHLFNIREFVKLVVSLSFKITQEYDTAPKQAAPFAIHGDLDTNGPHRYVVMTENVRLCSHSRVRSLRWGICLTHAMSCTFDFINIFDQVLSCHNSLGRKPIVDRSAHKHCS